MANILIRNLSFNYNNPQENIIDNASLNISTNWKTGLVGSSGSGKSTFLKLLAEELNPVSGAISPYDNSVYFPYRVNDESRSALDVIKKYIAPFEKWESEMKNYLSKGDSDSLFKYEETIRQFEENNGNNIDILIKQEALKIGLELEKLERAFYSLRDGEKTRALLVAIFLKKNTYPLIDDLSNLFNLCEKEYVADYLSQNQKGFLISSNDRFMLDTAANHIIALDKKNVRLNRGNYSVFKLQIDLENDFEERRQKTSAISESNRYCNNELVEESLEAAGNYVNNNFQKSAFLSAKNISEKSEAQETILSIENLFVKIAEKTPIKNFSLTLNKGERACLIDRKGLACSLLLKVIEQKIEKFSGKINIQESMEFSIVNKYPLWISGYLLQLLIENGIDVHAYKETAVDFNLGNEIFENPLENFRMNDLKLIELCRAFCNPQSLQLWNLPLHFLDISSRELLEKLIEDYELTILFTENDRFFISNVSDKIIDLPS